MTAPDESTPAKPEGEAAASDGGGGPSVAIIAGLSVLAIAAAVEGVYLYFVHDERNRLTDQVTILRQDEASLKETEARLRGEIDGLEERIGALEGERNAEAAAKTALEGVLDEVRGELATTNTALGARTGELEAALGDAKREAARAKAAEAQVAALEEALDEAKKLAVIAHEELEKIRETEKENVAALLDRVRTMRREMEAASGRAIVPEGGSGPEGGTSGGGGSTVEILADGWVGNPAGFLDKLRRVATGEHGAEGELASDPGVKSYERTAGSLAMGIVRWVEGRDARTGRPGMDPDPEAAKIALGESRDLLIRGLEKLEPLAESGSKVREADPEIEAVEDAARRYLTRAEEWLAED